LHSEKKTHSHVSHGTSLQRHDWWYSSAPEPCGVHTLLESSLHCHNIPPKVTDYFFYCLSFTEWQKSLESQGLSFCSHCGSDQPRLCLVVFISFYQFWGKSLFSSFLSLSTKACIHSKHCLALILWVSTSLICCRHDGLHVYKVSKSWGRISQLQQYRFKNRYSVLLLIKLSTSSTTFDAKMRSDCVSANISYWLSVWWAARTKSDQNLRADILTTTKEIKKQLCSLVPNQVGNRMLSCVDNWRCCWGVDTFCMEVPPFDAIFWPVQKIFQNSFKNRTLLMGLPLPKCTKCKLFRHEEL
jgi:hypothetical protein